MKNTKRQKRIIILLLSFLIPAIILQISYFAIGFYPVGDRTPLTIDLYHQYVSFLSELRRKIMSGESLFYSWSVGLGTNFYALIAYYAASPLNLLLLIFPQGQISTAVMVLTVLKIGLSGSAMSYFLLEGPAKRLGEHTVSSKSMIRSNTLEDKSTDIFIIIIATAYALNAFNLAYSWDIMWLDVVALLPLVALGVNRLVRERRMGLYIITLALSLMINYYIAFFTCFFTLVYFFVVYISAKAEQHSIREEIINENLGIVSDNRISTSYTPKLDDETDQQVIKDNYDLGLLRLKFWPTFARIAIATGVALLISAIILLPTILSLFDTSAAGDAFPSDLTFQFNTFDFMGKNLMNQDPSIRDGLPNVYIGILIFIFLPIYIFSKKISASEKLGHLSLLAFLYISFNVNILNFIWHGMHYPNQLPYRYSFLFSFVLLIIIFRALTVMKEYKPSTLMILSLIGVAFVILYEHNASLSREDAIINILFFLIYLGIFALFRNPNFFRTASLLLAVVVIGELSINTLVTVNTIREEEVYTSYNSFTNDFEDVEIMLEELRADAGDDFYRMEILPQKTTNDGALYGYPGFTMFSSTSREDTARLFRKLGYHGNNINSYKFTASTPVGNSLLGIEYLLRKNGATRDVAIETVATHEEMTVSRNPFAIEIGVPTSEELLYWNPVYGSPFDNWNSLLFALGEEDLFIPFDLDVDSGFNFQPVTRLGGGGMSFRPESTSGSSLMTLTYTVPEDQYIYFAIDPDKRSSIEITINENLGSGGEDAETAGTVRLAENRSIHWIETFDLGFTHAGDEIEINVNQEDGNASTFKIYAVSMDGEAYESTMMALQDRMIDVQEWNANSLTATYNADQDGYLYLNIPYDSSWAAYIDGEKVETQAISEGALLSVPTTAGQHELELVFVPRGFNIGLVSSILGLIFIALIYLWQNKISKKEREELEEFIARKQDVTMALDTDGDGHILVEEYDEDHHLDILELNAVDRELALDKMLAFQDYREDSGNMTIDEINTLYDFYKGGSLTKKQKDIVWKVINGELENEETEETTDEVIEENSAEEVEAETVDADDIDSSEENKIEE